MKPPSTAADHFRILQLAAIARLVRGCAPDEGSLKSLLESWPFLAPHLAQLDALERDEDAAERFAEQEADPALALPIAALVQAARLDQPGLELLFLAGLVEEDARFGLLFEALSGTPGCRRPTCGMAEEWLACDSGGDPRDAVERLLELGFLEADERDRPRPEWRLRVASENFLGIDAYRHESLDFFFGMAEQVTIEVAA